MKILRALLIAVLAISIPLPGVAAALSASPCMQMQTAMKTSAMAGEVHSSHADMATPKADNGDHNCCCDQCTNCDSACAVSGAGTLNKPQRGALLAPVTQLQIVASATQTLPAHSPPLIRPPGAL